MDTVAAWSAGGFSFAFGLVVFRSLASLLFGRLAQKETQLDAATQHLIGQLTGQVETLLDRCTQIEAHHAQCLEELASLRGYVDGRGDANQHAQLIIAADRAAHKRKTGDKE